VDARQEIVRAITKAGFHAELRDWVRGATVIAAVRLVRTGSGLSKFERYVCLVPFPDGKWLIDPQYGEREIEETARQAANRVIEMFRTTR